MTRTPPKIHMICLLVTVSLLSTGCATLFKGTQEEVALSSDPTGAAVYVNGNMKGTTPLHLKLISKETYTIEFRKDGYQPQTVTITNRVGTKWVILDVLGGLAPVIVDVATGSWYQLDPNTAHAVLEPSPPM